MKFLLNKIFMIIILINYEKKINCCRIWRSPVSCVDIINNTNKFEIIGYVDQFEKNFFGLKYLGTDDEFINNFDKSILLF